MAKTVMNDTDLTQNYFELFDLSVQFGLDITELSARYKTAQRETHPDRFAACGQAEQRLAMQVSSLLNEAYKTLKDPVERAVYLLGLNGVDIRSPQNRQLAPQFLMEQMNLREELQSLADANDTSGLNRLRADIAGWINKLLDECSQQFQQTDYNAAANSVGKLQFYRKLLHETDALVLEYEQNSDL
jgi:molecular chaperone HscB